MSTARARAWVGGTPDQVVVVGVHPGQDPHVLSTAADLASRIGAGVVCVWVDPTRVFVGRETDGTLDVTPLDPDQDDDLGRVELADELTERVAHRLAGSATPWRFVYAAGETARGLTDVCADYAVSYVVVGTRRPGLAGWMNEAIGGSVAGRLAHTQPRPVVLVPLPGGRR